MTQSELLEKIKSLDGTLIFSDGRPPIENVGVGDKLNLALRQIVELHTYVLTGKKMRGKAGLSKRCTECGFAYPCSTIEIIHKELA